MNRQSDGLLTVMELLAAIDMVLLFIQLSFGTSTLARTARAQVAPTMPGCFTIDYTLITANSPDCEPSLADNYPVRVQYRTIFISADSANSNDVEATEWMDLLTTKTERFCETNQSLELGDAVKVAERTYHLLFQSNITQVNNSKRIQLRFIQSDHRGGFCDCWAVTNLNVNFTESTEESMVSLMRTCDISNGRSYLNSKQFFKIFGINEMDHTNCSLASADNLPAAALGFCNGSASVPRGFISIEVGANGTMSECRSVADVVDNGKEPPKVNEQCDSLPYIEVQFTLQLGGSEDGNSLNSFDEGVELAFQHINGNGEWIPLMFYTTSSEREGRILVGSTTMSSKIVNIRGYNVSYIVSANNQRCEHKVKVCIDVDVDNSLSSDWIKFRWIQSVYQLKEKNRDKVLLDDVQISVFLTQQQGVILFDDFDNQNTTINDTLWTGVQGVSLQCDNDNDDQCQLQFGEEAPSFGPTTITSSRGISTTLLNPLGVKSCVLKIRVFYNLIERNCSTCFSSQLQSTTSVLPQIQYQQGNNNWTTVNNCDGAEIISPFNGMSFEVDLDSCSDFVQLRFVQLEHRGGFCDCWAVHNISVNQQTYDSNNSPCDIIGNFTEVVCDSNLQGTSSLQSQPFLEEFCGGSASIPRGVVLHKLYPNRIVEDSQGCSESSVVEDLQICDESSVVVNSKSSPLSDCRDTEQRVQVTFYLEFLPWNSGSCNASTDSFHEGVEVSFWSVTTGEWIPMMYFVSPGSVPGMRNEDNSQRTIPLTNSVPNGTNGTFVLRGYRVPYIIANGQHHSISLCGDSSIFQQPLQFRWLQTSSQTKDGIQDVVLLDNITISLHEGTLGLPTLLFEDNFDLHTSSENLSLFILMDNVHLHNMSTVADCQLPNSSDGGALLFYTKPTSISTSHNPIISSRQVIVGPLDPRTTTLNSISTNMPRFTRSRARDKEEEALANIGHNKRLSQILDLIEESPGSALDLLATYTMPTENSGGSEVNLLSATYLLSAIGNVFGNDTVEPILSDLFLSVADNLLDAAQNNVNRGTNSPEDVAGSTLLLVLERFSLQNHEASHQPASTNIVFRVEDTLIDESLEQISPIERENSQITIPKEVFDGVKRGNRIRMASFLFTNMSGLLPERLDNSLDNKSDERVFRLASPVISASFLCDNCTTSNFSAPVQVAFQHTPYDVTLMENDRNGSEVMCVFWDFDDTYCLSTSESLTFCSQQPDAVLFSGEWSQEGCYVNEDMSTITRTVCECNHLTNFAILLSARPIPFTHQQTLALQITGYIGVSISLVAMAATVFVFIFLKPLHTMRNYIHIQLCITLGIAQIIFVAGVEPRLGEEYLVGGVPVGCRLVAVLLHYWFLVSFMWMLMEGVVLYVVLVRVFVKYHARYIAAFTVASYGLPLLYVGGLTVPLGFARNEDIRNNQIYDYGYQQACYLNPATSFTWSFIAPVIVILLANTGFFIMATVIMFRHQKRQHGKSRAQRVKPWLKATISLTIVMGITWITGVLVIEVETLFALAYIFTIFVAFQGLFIFVIFVLLSKQVRENYAKWWKAKVAESDFLSKHFGEKSLTTALTSRHTAPSKTATKSIEQSSSVAAKEKEDLSQSQVLKNSYTDTGVLDYGNFFTVTFVPDASATMFTNPASAQAQESSCDDLEMMELNERRAVPNHYVAIELRDHHFHDNSVRFDSDEQLL